MPIIVITLAVVVLASPLLLFVRFDFNPMHLRSPNVESVATYIDAETRVLSAPNGVDYAYRATGSSDAPPLVTLQHFRGNLDNWDPALIDALARGRRVITFDNQGVAASSGRTPNTIAQMALDAIDFIQGRAKGDTPE